MDSLPTPTRTLKARQWLDAGETSGDHVKRALLSSIDGHRNVIQLESFARAMGLSPDALERLRTEGLIDLAR
ncbi:MAG: hypothetical protein H7Y61_13355 [Rhizobiales bacterium]|nr:hypothetical protein [Rhizobacter sp.]